MQFEALQCVTTHTELGGALSASSLKVLNSVCQWMKCVQRDENYEDGPTATYCKDIISGYFMVATTAIQPHLHKILKPEAGTSR